MTTFEFTKLVQSRLVQRGIVMDVDGDPGPKTLAGLDQCLPDKGSIILSSDASVSEKHFALALPYKGISEQAGSGTHPALIPMLDLTPDWLDRDDSKTAWCGIFRGWIGHKAGTGIPKNHFRAAEWAKWGAAVPLERPTKWQRGDTIIMKRTGGYHVCFLDRVEGSYAWVLGGNQSNSVNISKYALSGIIAVRR